MLTLMQPETLYWGLKFSDWISLCGLLLGPIVAVAITLWIEGRRKKRDQRMIIARVLLTTRHLPGDPGWSTAINLIPAEFNDSQPVMAAWRAYIEAVRYKPADADKPQHDMIVTAKQTSLIYAIMKLMKFNLSESDIQISAYAAGGFIDRDNILIASQRAMPEIAATLRRQLELIEGRATDG